MNDDTEAQRNVYDQAVARLKMEIDRDEYSLCVWGRPWADLSEHERSEVQRFIATPLGGGFTPRPQ